MLSCLHKLCKFPKHQAIINKLKAKKIRKQNKIDFQTTWNYFLYFLIYFLFPAYYETCVDNAKKKRQRDVLLGNYAVSWFVPWSYIK